MSTVYIAKSILVLCGVLIFGILMVNCQFFAEEINDKTYLGRNITVIHSCTPRQLICTQISIQLSMKSTFLFEKPTCMDCSKINDANRSGKSQKSVIPLFIQDQLRCAPNYWNEDPVFIHAARLHLFLIRKDVLHMPKNSETYSWATKKIVYDLKVPSPYSREGCLQLNTRSHSFYHDLMYLKFSKWHSPLVQGKVFRLMEIIFTNLLCSTHSSIIWYISQP